MTDSAYTPSVNEHWPKEQIELNKTEKKNFATKISDYIQKHNAVLIAHYYAPPEIQALAEQTQGFIGDSLAMAQFGAEHDADILIVAGVKFMGETAKILAPHKKVIMPTLDATCSLDLNCPIDKFNQFCDAHPDRTIVVYANTSAAVKARADWVVTSSIGLQIVEHLHTQGEKILWAPDKHLGHYLQQQTGADMVLYDSACIVHEEFKSKALKQLREQYPNAAILVHPEAPTAVVAMADVVGSTSQLLKAAITMPNERFIVATEEGIFYKMHQQAPKKQFILAPTMGKGATCRSCGYCPWMKMNSLQSMWHSLEADTNQVSVPEETRQQALISINRMLEFAKQNGI